MKKCQTATEYLIILAVVIVIALITVGVLSIPERAKYKITCVNDTKLFALWNYKIAEENNISQDTMINITYSYLYNYTIDCPRKGTQDCFVEIPIERCCMNMDYCTEKELGQKYLIG